ncbi:MAG: 30S ribosome-binding factor RbfA [Rhodobacteraceae bacterium]|nr:30S ribosome-binding factor RbfA [Paracoccaceae bacterium]
MAKRYQEEQGPTLRQRRVAEMLRRALSEVISENPLKETELPDLPVTVGEVRLSPDLRRATVFVLPLGGEHAEEFVKALNREKREIRRALNRRIHLKRSPDIRFVSDPVFDQLDRMQQLFDSEDVKRDLTLPANGS